MSRRLALAAALVLGAACASRQPDVIFLPSSAEVIEQMLAVAAVGADDVVFDLGCGDGRIVIAAARERGARGVCVELDASLVETSRRKADSAGIGDRIEHRRADMFETDLAGATVVALYLSPALNERLRPKLLRELPAGARVVSHNFPMGDWRPDTAVKVMWPSGATSAVYGWVVPADVAGRWSVSVAGDTGVRRYRVWLTQHYQEVNGTASADGRPAFVRMVRLRGDRIEMEIGEPATRGPVLRLSGRVSGGTMEGLVGMSGSAAGRRWRAMRP